MWRPKPRRVQTEDMERKLQLWRHTASPKAWRELLAEPSVYKKGSHAYKKFRQRFRVPADLFDEELFAPTSAEPRFADKEAGEGSGVRVTLSRHPLRIKLLATLRVLGSGCDFTFAEEMADISEPCLRNFFHEWCKWVATGPLYKKWVYHAQGQELEDDMGACPSL